jgi:hypothetical protein
MDPRGEFCRFTDIEKIERKAFAAGQEWIWEDLEQTERVPRYDDFEDWKRTEERRRKNV